MSSPTPDFDQLLSDHLDGRLGETETQIVEQQLLGDTALRRHYDGLVSDRQAIRNLFTKNSDAPGLPPNFATGVLAEARRRGLQTTTSTSENRASTDTTIRPAGRRPETDSLARLRKRIAIGLIATAAAVLIMVTWNRPIDEATQSIAQIPASHDAIADRAVADLAPADISTEVRGDVPIPLPENRFAVSEPRMEPRMDSPPALDTVASAEMPTPMADGIPETVSISDDESVPLFNASFTGAVMVYDVRLTSTGRTSGTFSKAMQRNGLNDADRQPINRDVIAAARQANTFDENDQFQILFLQAPAKKVDRMFLDLLRDRGSVESVGLSLITDTPILEMASRLTRVDATEVQHDRPLARELGSRDGGDEDDEQLATLRRLLGDQTYLPLDGGVAPPQDNVDAASLSGSGNDVITRVLILVR